MKQFKVSKRLSLEFLGEGWDKCYINFKPFSLEDLKVIDGLQPKEGDEETTTEAVGRIFDLLESRFISGKGLTEDGIVELEASDLRDLPVELITEATKILSGTPSPN